MSGQLSVSAVKAAQAVNFFLQQSASDPFSVEGDNYLKLTKLLWAADRLSLRNFGNSVTQNRYVALPYGPVASQTFKLMEACQPNASVNLQGIAEADVLWWQARFEFQGHSLRDIADPGSDYLSQPDLHMLEAAYKRFRTSSPFGATDDVSHRYPEWTRAFDPVQAKKSFDIDLADFFDDPEQHVDPYFQVAPETLEAAWYFFEERKELSASIGIAL